ncbi:hypothetical protein [uncultured Nostoc sp.]|uniref:hypothetical protein n=1 Tax=uncultured Nostoc sp. TaxID=340711 RepID=UPI0035CC5B10
MQLENISSIQIKCDVWRQALPQRCLTVSRLHTTHKYIKYKRRSQQKLDALQAEFDIRSEKFKQMTKAIAIEAGTAVKFQLEQQLLDAEAKLAHLSDELDKIESALQL